MNDLTRDELYQVTLYFYGLLDDIDTTSDIAKSDDVLYREMVEKIQAKRHLAVSENNGYTIAFKSVSDDCKLLIDAVELDQGPEGVARSLISSVLRADD